MNNQKAKASLKKSDSPAPAEDSDNDNDTKMILDTSISSLEDTRVTVKSSKMLSPTERFVMRENLCKLKLPFPWKLHQLLDDVACAGFEAVVSWLPGGRAFRVHKPEAFSKKIMTKYFRQTKFSSFTRQLYIYGFTKIEGGDHHGGYYHPRFIREDKSASMTLTRNAHRDRRLKHGPEDAGATGLFLPGSTPNPSNPTSGGVWGDYSTQTASSGAATGNSDEAVLLQSPACSSRNNANQPLTIPEEQQSVAPVGVAAGTAGTSDFGGGQPDFLTMHTPNVGSTPVSSSSSSLAILRSRMVPSAQNRLVYQEEQQLRTQFLPAPPSTLRRDLDGTHQLQQQLHQNRLVQGELTMEGWGRRSPWGPSASSGWEAGEMAYYNGRVRVASATTMRGIMMPSMYHNQSSILYGGNNTGPASTINFPSQFSATRPATTLDGMTGEASILPSRRQYEQLQQHHAQMIAASNNSSTDGGSIFNIEPRSIEEMNSELFWEHECTPTEPHSSGSDRPIL